MAIDKVTTATHLYIPTIKIANRISSMEIWKVQVETVEISISHFVLCRNRIVTEEDENRYLNELTTHTATIQLCVAESRIKR